MSTRSSWDQDKRAPTIGNCRVLYEMDRGGTWFSPRYSVRDGTSHSLAHLTGQSMSTGLPPTSWVRGMPEMLGGASWGYHMVPVHLGDCAGSEEGRGILVGNDRRPMSGWVCVLLHHIGFIGFSLWGMILRPYSVLTPHFQDILSQRHIWLRLYHAHIIQFQCSSFSFLFLYSYFIVRGTSLCLHIWKFLVSFLSVISSTLC